MTKHGLLVLPCGQAKEFQSLSWMSGVLAAGSGKVLVACPAHQPNDDMHAGANDRLVPGLIYYGTLPKGDSQDYFYIDLPGDGAVELWLTDIPAGHDYDLYLRNAQGTLLAESSQYGDTDEHIVTGILPQGRYCIQIHHCSPGGSTQPNNLWFEYP